MNLSNKTIVITGGGQGLGRSMAISLATHGAKLALIDLNKDVMPNPDRIRPGMTLQFPLPTS